MMMVAASAGKLRDWLDKGRPDRSQDWLARVLGVSQPTVYRWVTGEFRPDTHFRWAIHYLSEGKVSFDGWFFPDEKKLAYLFRTKRARDRVFVRRST